MSKEIPLILYKYRDWNNNFHKRVLTDNEIYFAAPKEFNDPFDCAIPFRYDERELTEENIFRKYLEVGKRLHPDLDDTKLHQLAYEEQRKNLIFNEQHLEKQNESRQKNFNETFRILSLTEKRDNFLMWSHYSASHSGFCVGYNSIKLFQQSQGQLGPVIYRDEFPTFGLFDESRVHFIKYAYHKARIWEYEAEYRLLRTSQMGNLLKVNNEIVEEIILGYKMKQEDKSDILKLAERKFPKAKVFDSTIHKTKFEIVIDQIR